MGEEFQAAYVLIGELRPPPNQGSRQRQLREDRYLQTGSGLALERPVRATMSFGERIRVSNCMKDSPVKDAPMERLFVTR